MAGPSQWQDAAERLTAALRLVVAPIVITFGAVPEAAPFADPSAPMPVPAPDGRTGRVPAGCVFWVHALDRTFTTDPRDHGNCSVGSLTHGLIDPQTADGRADVAALVEAGWVTADVFPAIPTVTTRPDAITYGPLADATTPPAVVLVRTTPEGS